MGEVRCKEMKVLVMGLGRSGTTGNEKLSLASGFKQMGFTPYDYIDRFLANHVQDWNEAMKAKYEHIGKPWTKKDFDQVTKEFDCILDVPCCFFAEDLIQAYPNAKVILNTRDTDEWLRSMDQTLFTVFRWPSWQLLRYTDPKVAGAWCRHNEIIWGHFCDGEYDNREKCKRRFLQHYDHVRKVVPPERLLEFDIKKGWGPLTDFLGLPEFKEQRPAFAEGPECNIPVKSFRDIFHDVLTRDGQRNALVSVYQEGDSCFAARPKNEAAHGPLIYTFQELHKHASSLAASLYAYGLRPRERLATFLNNSAEFAIALLAAAFLNITCVPLDLRNLTRPEEIRHQLGITKPAAFLVFDELCAEQLNGLESIYSPKPRLKIIVNCVGSSPPGWTSWVDVHEERAEYSASLSVEEKFGALDTDEDLALIIFTSGTSGLPKACPLTCKNVSCIVSLPRQIRSEERVLQVLPVSHVWGVGQFLQAWAAGASIVIPSSSFNAKATLDAIEQQSCTIMGAVPAIIDQILTLPDFSPKKVQSLDFVIVGATMASPEIIAKCEGSEGLGARVARPAYGMTEALALLTCEDNEELFVENGILSVGKPLQGTKVKICAPDSRITRMRGEIGELHVSTPVLTPGYLEMRDDNFYTDSRCRWFKTGDQARMHDLGAIFILGRYKDVIIRGGENLSSTSIEDCISSQFPSIQAHVVGANDSIAGEVPIAVLRAPNGLRPDAMQIQKAVRERLGPASVPEQLLTLEDLDLKSLPSTTSGKIQKQELKKLVARHLEEAKLVRAPGETSRHSEKLSFDMKVILLETLDAMVDNYSQDPSMQEQPLRKILDSLSLMSLASTLRIKRKLDLSITDMTLSQNLDDLVSRAKQGKADQSHIDAGVSKEGPPERVDLIFEEERGRTKKVADPALQQLGLNWDTDVQEVFPIAGTSAWGFMKENPFRHKWTFATSLSSYDQVRDAVERSLRQWPVLRSIVVEYSNELRLLVAMRAHARYFDLAISSLPDAENTEALRDIETACKHEKGSFPQGLLFHVGISKVTTTGTFSLFLGTNHAAYDLISIHLWAADLQRIMTGDTHSVRTPFKLFADAYYLYQNSVLARRAKDYQQQKFVASGISQKALWPAAGENVYASMRNKLKPRTTVDSQLKRGAGIVERTLHCPNLTRTRFSQELVPAIIAKIAISLFNFYMTGQPQAALWMLMSGRMWPFTSSGISELLPSPYDIAGPTVTSIVDVVTIDPLEEIGEFYGRMEAQQEEVNRYQHLPQTMSGQVDEDSNGMRNQAMRQIFNWIPGRRGKEQDKNTGLQPIGIPGQDNDPPPGVVWTCMIAGTEDFYVRLRWNLSLFLEDQATGFVDRLLQIFEWLCVPDHWHRKVEEIHSVPSAGQPISEQGDTINRDF
ncbi:hypothetical protein ACLMJK_009264 [Lecanora helva]